MPEQTAEDAYQGWLRKVGEAVKNLALRQLHLPDTKILTDKLLGLSIHDGKHLAAGDSMLATNQWVYAILYILGVESANPLEFPPRRIVGRGKHVGTRPRAWTQAYWAAWKRLNGAEVERLKGELNVLRRLDRVAEPADWVLIKTIEIKTVRTVSGNIADPTEVDTYDVPADDTPIRFSTFVAEDQPPVERPVASQQYNSEQMLGFDLAQLMGAFGIGLQTIIQQAALAAIKEAARDAVAPMLNSALESAELLDAVAVRLEGLLERAMDTGDAALDNELGSLAKRLSRQLRVANEGGATTIARVQDKFRQELTGLHTLLSIILDLRDSQEDTISFHALRIRQLMEAAYREGDSDLQQVHEEHGQAVSDALPWIRRAAESDPAMRKKNLRLMGLAGKSRAGGLEESKR